MNRTIPQLFETSVRHFGQNIILWEKKYGSYQGSTYQAIQALVYQFAAGLISLGVQPGNRIALIAEGRNEWVIGELGILYTGAINVPLSVKLTESADLKFRLQHSGCKGVVVSSTQASKITLIKNELPDLQFVILLDDQQDLGKDEILLRDLYEKGKQFLNRQSDLLHARWTSIAENDPANICYTSGTTADPKGVVVTHRNYTSNIEQASAMLTIPERYCSLLILPWDHCFAHTAGIYTLMSNGASMASVHVGKTPLETLKNIPVNIKETRPTFLLSVPALAKNFRKNIESALQQKGALVAWLFRKALATAYTYNGDGWNRGKGIRKLRRPMYRLFDRILFSKIRQNFGGRLEFFIGGGALLDIELQKFFYAIGIPMYQGYGLSEASPIISANVPIKHKLGSSGTVVPNLELKICNEKGHSLPAGMKGEIVVKGENVMAGYWKNPKATAETIRDGWLFTGDIGYLDNDGFLFVLGRDKSLLIGNDGEKYSPEGIEETICSHSAYIDQMMLYNNQSPYTTCLLVPNRDAVLRWIKAKNLSCSTVEGQEAVLKLLESEITVYRTNEKYADLFPDRWLPSAFAVLGEGFTEQNGFLNSTLKMVRGKITEFFKNRIDQLYTAEGKNICNQYNMKVVSSFEK